MPYAKAFVHIKAAVFAATAIGMMISIMSLNPRPTSSIYSDSFDLEDLVSRLSQQARSQAFYEIKALQDERDALQRQVEAERSAWVSVYQVILESSRVGTQLSLVCDDSQRQIDHERSEDRERKRQLANLTPI